MTGDELKRWRENHGLSQEALASLLGPGWNRQLIANMEIGRRAIDDDFPARLETLAAALGLQAQAASDKPNEPRIRFNYAKNLCWDLNGLPMPFSVVEQAPLGFQFYRKDSSKNLDDDTGHLLANLYEKTRKFPNGQCTFFQLDLEDWRVQCVAWKDHPAHVKALATLNTALSANRSFPQ